MNFRDGEYLVESLDSDSVISGCNPDVCFVTSSDSVSRFKNTFSNYGLQDPWFWRASTEMASGARKVDKGGPLVSTRATLLLCFIY